MFIPAAWPLLSTFRRINATILVTLPYVFLYYAASRDPGYILPANHPEEMALYPYDFTVFHPGNNCRTCNLLKPARSKHCNICKHCISKFDHHCIFINNCVGYANQHFFLLLLLTTGLLTAYASYIGTSLVSSIIVKDLPEWNLLGRGYTWTQYFNIWAFAMQENTRMSAITLLCILTTPLVFGLLGYHIYLIWAGTTTNESLKWGDWAAEMCDGYVFKRFLPEDRQKNLSIEPEWTRWPADSNQIVLRTEDGGSPIGECAIGEGEWERVWKLADLENLYDLGFWDNAKDVFCARYRAHGRYEQRRRPQEATRSRPSSAGIA